MGAGILLAACLSSNGDGASKMPAPIGPARHVNSFLWLYRPFIVRKELKHSRGLDAGRHASATTMTECSRLPLDIYSGVLTRLQAELAHSLPRKPISCSYSATSLTS